MPKFGMKNGKFVMTPGGKWSSQCAECIYKASDGSAYQDDFSSPLDPGWNQVSGTWQTAGGRLQETSASGTHSIERTNNIGTDILNDMIVEVDLFPVSGILRPDLMGVASAGFVWQLNQNTLPADGLSVDHDCVGPGFITTVQAVRNAGDKLTIRLNRTGTNEYRGCYFLNETLIYQRDNVSYTPQPDVTHGVFIQRIGTGVSGEFDNYTAEIQSSP